VSFQPWVCKSGPIHTDVVVVAEPEKFLSHELCVIVGALRRSGCQKR
jgi:hypothetical protein